MTTLPASDTQPMIAAPPHRPGMNPWLVRIPLLVILGGMLTVTTLIVVFVLFQLSVAGRIAPGVSAYGIELGGLTQAEAAAALQNAFAYADDTVFTFRYEDEFWQFTAAELGVSLDADATAQAALDASQDEAVLPLAVQAQAWLSGINVQPVVRFEEGVARSQLEAAASEFSQAPQNAQLVINGLNIETVPAQTGLALDVDTALADLRERITALEPGGEITLSVVESQPEWVDVESTAAYIRTALSAPIMLVANDVDGNLLGPWSVTPQQIVALLDVTPTTDEAGNPSYTVNIDMNGFAPYLQSLAPGLIVPARDGRFVFNDELGQLEALAPARDGRTLDVQATIERMEEAVFSVDKRTVEVAFNYTRPRYHNNITAAELGITEMVSSSRTFYTGSTAARRHNIENGAAFYNGVIVGPGETFSFNDIIGDISEETGFVEGAIIFGGRTVKGVGGGVCQVSTTAYRAAFFGGYPIKVRFSHGYRVFYYELGNAGPGLDAAIYTPTADFQFVNDADHHLLIETEFIPDEDAVEFRFYSTNPGRTIEVGEPIVRNEIQPGPVIYEANPDLQPGQQLQVDWAQTGGDVVVTRTIRDEQGNVLERNDYATRYEPWSSVVQVAPGDPRLSQNS